MIPNDLHYNFPLAVYLFILVIALFILLCRLYFFRESVLERFAKPKILNKVLIPRSRYNFWGKVAAICMAWILAILALMQPEGNGHYPLEGTIEAAGKPKGKEKEAIVQRKAHDVIFLVDASASMGATDTRTKATRLDYAKEIVDEAISRLRGESVALYAFTSDTTKLSPLTMDYLFVRLMLRQMQINEGEIAGTNLVEAIADMRDFHFSILTPKLKTLILLTDGGDTQLEELTGQERKHQIAATLNLVENADINQLRIFTIGMGTK
ncbi:MAG: VWA domain-containing protein [Waddliaceae bacterium]